MLWTRQCRTLRAGLRRNRADAPPLWQVMRKEGSLASLGIAVVFCIAAIAILTMRQDVMPYRPGQYVPRTIHSRVAFSFVDKDLLTKVREDARGNVPRIYKSTGEVWDALADQLRALPDQVGGRSIDEIPPQLRDQFKLDQAAPFISALDSATVTMLDQYRLESRRKGYNEAIDTYIQPLRKLILLRPEDRTQERRHQEQMGQQHARIEVNSAATRLDDTYSTDPTPDLLTKFLDAAAVFPKELQLKIVAYTANNLRPTNVVDEDATAMAQNQAADSVHPRQAEVFYSTNRIIKRPGVLDERDWQLLKAEHTAFLESLSPGTLVKSKIGAAGIVVLLATLLGGYIWYYQRRVVKNHARAWAIALLLLAMLLLAQLAAIGTGPLYLFGIAPTILVAMILAIAYDRRFAMGIACIHGVLVTAALDQGIGFFLILLVGIFTCCFLLDEVRTRSKLIEVGGATAVMMMLATLAVGMVPLDPVEPLMFIGRNCLHAGAAGLAVGFIVLGILPFVEKSFRITTSMTLLELADANQPLLRRLSLEAPGTYNHSLQVATLAEEAAEAIGANSLLCRVGAYYHDIGKMNKADYFVENQADGRNRHLNLTPSVSLLIIIGHVKDGIELAREYNLPTRLFPFIQQHHGTTLVEYFYHQACSKKDKGGPDAPAISETQYRYPGPKPRLKEVAILMLADAAESACRAMPEPNASRIETLVHSLATRRLVDGQFDECDLTMRDLERIERALVKALVGIYHGRLAYPSNSEESGQEQAGGMAVKTA